MDGTQAALFLINLALGVLVSLVLWQMRELRSSLKERISEQGQDLKELRDDLNRFKAAVPHQYVLREDFVRAVATLEQKIDRLGEHLGELNRNVARLVVGGDERAGA